MELEKNQQGSPIITVCTYKFFELASPNRHLRTVTLSSKVHCNENPIYDLLFLGIGRPHSQFPHSCVCEQLIKFQDQSTYFLQQNRQIHRGNILIAHRHMNVEIGTVAAHCAQSLFCEYLFQIFGIGSLQCIGTNTYCTIYNSVNTILIY
jgi:hypothetical protein